MATPADGPAPAGPDLTREELVGRLEAFRADVLVPNATPSGHGFCTRYVSHNNGQPTTVGPQIR
jgi:hypothetical protein